MTAGRVVDAGLQAERTALAWERTTLGFVIVAALLLRVGVLEDLVAVQLFAVLVLAAAGAGLVVARVRYRRRDASLRDADAPAPGVASIAAVGTLAVVLSWGAVVTVVAVTLRAT